MAETLTPPTGRETPVAVLEARDLTPGDLTAEAARLRDDGWRPATVTCVAASDQGAELIYHFQRGMDLVHYRMLVPGGVTPPSLTSLFPCAFLAENEIQDQFGLAFEGLTPDLKGRMYMHGGTPPLRGQAEPEPAGGEGESA